MGDFREYCGGRETARVLIGKTANQTSKICIASIKVTQFNRMGSMRKSGCICNKTKTVYQLTFFPPGKRVWTQGLTLARQALYHLSHSTSPLLSTEIVHLERHILGWAGKMSYHIHNQEVWPSELWSLTAWVQSQVWHLLGPSYLTSLCISFFTIMWW
jgi:hypothetical protein